jgi:GNAT superfamily N-acetyltransferase
MNEYQLISDYKHVQKYREGFNELAKKVFKLDFEEWYNRGCWNDNYICHSYVDRDQMIANASINKMTITSNGKEYKALQVGTMMTHPDYRYQGLAAKLMNHIIDKYEKEYDFIYLFANSTALDFYPKFGFERVQESSFTLMASNLKKADSPKFALCKLDINNAEDFKLMKRFAAERIPVSSRLGVRNNEHLLMFYFILVFRDAAYYLEGEDVIVLFEREDHRLHIFDVVCKKPIDLEIVVNHLISEETEMIHFYFMPDSEDEHIQSALMKEPADTLFVRPLSQVRLLRDEVKSILFPLTSHA